MHTRWTSLLKLAGAALLLAAAMPARAVATLDVWFSDATCTVTHLGVDTVIPCSGPQGLTVTATLGPGDIERIDAILHYRYTDQGLPVAPFSQIQMDASGFGSLPLSFEAGALMVRSALCQGHACGGPPWLLALGTPAFPPLVLGNNASPDTLTGQWSVFSGYALDSGTIGTMTLSASLGAQALVWSGSAAVAPIPEPATWALLMLGIGLVGWAGARRPRTA